MGHWLLAVVGSSGVRILDSSPEPSHIKFAEAKIKSLFPDRPGVWGVIQDNQDEDYAQQRTGPVDSSVATLVYAFRTITGVSGSGMHSMWRDILFLVVETAKGHTCDIPWAGNLDENTLTMDRGQGGDESRKQIWCPGADGIVQYDVACSEIDAQERYLSEQRARLETARSEKAEKRARTADQAHEVYDVLRILPDKSSERANTLKAEKVSYEEILFKLGNSQLGLLSGGHAEEQLRECLKHVDILLKRRENASTTLLKVVEKLEEGIKALEGCSNQITGPRIPRAQ